MISFLQRFLQRHHKFFFWGLLIVIFVSFILTITPAGSGLTGRGDKIREQNFFGKNLAGPDWRSMLLGAQVSSWINTGNRYNSQGQTEQIALQRTALIALAEQQAIPAPTEEELNDYIRNKRIFMGANGLFDPELYNQFLESIRTTPPYSEELVRKTLVEDYRSEQLNKALVGPGFILPYEALKQVERQKTIWSVEVASLDYSAYDPEIEVDEQELQEYYESSKERYVEPQKAMATAIVFKTANYTNRIATPTEPELEIYFQQNRFRFQKSPEPVDPTNPAEAAANPAETTLADVRDEVETAWITERAKRLAEEEAVNFIDSLYSEEVKKNGERYESLISQANAEKRILTPFARNQMSAGSGIAARDLAQVFDLPPGRYYSDIVSTPDGAAILIHEGYIEERTPPLEEVRSVVEANFKESERRRLFNERGTVLHEEFTQTVSEGKSFRETAEAEGLTVESYDEFTSVEPPENFNRSLFTQNEDLEVGQISPMVFLEQTGKFVYLKEKNVPEISESDPEVQTALNQLSNFTALINGQALVTEIIVDEQKRMQQESRTP